jgi:hypothetical protein
MKDGVAGFADVGFERSIAGDGRTGQSFLDEYAGKSARS